MRRDHETTTPEAAAEFDRLHTPTIRDEPADPSECVGLTADPDPATRDWWHTHVLRHVELDRLRAEQTRSWR